MKVLLDHAAYSPDFKTPGYGQTPALASFAGKTLLDAQISLLLYGGAGEIVVLLPEGTDKGSLPEGKQIRYTYLKKPLGGGGSLAKVAASLGEFLFVPGNLLPCLDLSRFYKAHSKGDGFLTLFAQPKPYPETEDIVLSPDGKHVSAIMPKGADGRADFNYQNLVPLDLCIVSADLSETFDPEEEEAFPFHDGVLLPTVESGLACYYSSPEIVHRLDDEGLIPAEKDYLSGRMEARNLKNPQRAIFLDRDGTINVFGDYVVRPEMLTLLPFASEAIKKINDSPYLCICATNQPLVARGEASLAQVNDIHAYMGKLLGAEGACLDALYVCPHFPKEHFHGRGDDAYLISCSCRKPKIGMLEKAKAAFNIDLTKSYFIGDTLQDVQTGINAGAHPLLVTCGDPRPAKKCADAVPEATFSTTLEAVEYILK